MDKVHYARYFITETLLQFSLLGGVLVLYGVVRTYRNGWRSGLYGEVIAMFTSSLLLIWMLDFDYDSFKTSTFRPYLLVAYCIFAIWLGYAIDFLIKIAGKWHKLSSPIIYIGFGLIILTLCIYNSRINYRADDRFAEQYAQSLFDVVEQNAILVPYGDAYVFTTAYYHLVEGKRPDIRLLEPNGLVLNDRIIHSSWFEKQKTATWRKFAKSTNRPFYHQSLFSDLINETGHSKLAFTQKVNKSMLPGRINVETNDFEKAFFKKMIALTETRDRWIIDKRNSAIKSYGLYLGYAMAINSPVINNYIEDVLPLAENNYWSLIGMTTTSLLLRGLEYVPIAEKNIKKARHLADDQLGKSDIAMEFYLEGFIALKKGNSRKARNLFRKSIKISSKKTNPSYKALKKL